jgi:alpha-L-arabinofuranosidase
MQNRRRSPWGAVLAVCAVVLFFATTLSFARVAVADPAGAAQIRIECDRPTVPLSPHLYGLFFEDINYGADGGLYAELVRNRSFEYHSLERTHRGTGYHPLYAWTKVERNGGRAVAQVVNTAPLNDNNRNYLQLRIDQPGAVGMSNSGYVGIPVDQGAVYDVSLYARTEDWNGDSAITVTVEDEDGVDCGSVVLQGADATWKKLEGVLTATKTIDQGRLVVTTAGHGTLNLDMVSLFPQDTFMGRKNGLRKDLAQSLKDLNPKFLRFPGGCVAHGWGLDNIYRWKDSVGDVAERKPNWNLWGYHQSYGLGYFEYFLLCKDLGMAPLPVVPVGVSCGFRGIQYVPIDQLQPHIQDAIDLIEFANGPVSSQWGAVRAEMGHPEPFHLEYICLGNEEHDTPGVRERFPYFVKAIREAHPEIKIIGTSGLGPGLPLYDLMTELEVYSSDEHYYESPEWFLRNQHRFDSFDRNKPKIFVGEYAAHDTGRRNTLFSAVSEAAYLTGIERNGDIVDMTCYAPLFGREGHSQWNPDLIYFDNRQVVRTTNYYVQQLFAQNKGDAYVPSSITMGETQQEPVSSAVGIGSWNTTIEVAEVTVHGRKIDPTDWRVSSGTFRTSDGKYVQTDARAMPAMSLGREVFTGETITYTVRARKTGGAEGFLVRFGADGEGNGGYWWNVGGWQNTRHAIERFTRGDRRTVVVDRPGSVRSGEWYDLKVEHSSNRIRCYIDGEKVLDYVTQPASISVSTTIDRAAGEVIVKLVNPLTEPMETSIVLQGVKQVAPRAKLITLAGEKDATNTFDNPDLVVPVHSEIAVAPEFKHTIPAMSVQCIRIGVESLPQVSGDR